MTHIIKIAWSIGNDVLEAGTPQAVSLAGEMVELVHSLDHSRPVTLAMAAEESQWANLDPLAAMVDIAGYNNMIDQAEVDYQRDPERVIWQTGSSPLHAYDNYMKVKNLNYVIGDFAWTGIDYIGNRSGLIGFNGELKPAALYRNMLYNNVDTICMSVREPGASQHFPMASWTWPGQEDKPMEVEIFTRSPKVRLYLNDSIIDTRTVGESSQFKTVIPVNYRPGTLRAVALDNADNEVKSTSLSTAGKVADIKVDYERITNNGTDYDLVFVNVSLVDKDGNVNTAADDLLSFKVSQNARILATGTSDEDDPTGYTATVRNAYRGRAAAVIQTPRMQSPTLTITNASLPASTTILTNK